MAIIFSRLVHKTDGSEYEGYESTLSSWENDANLNLEERAMAVNLRHDRRVSETRELHFRNTYFEPHKNLIKALKDHAVKEIKFRSDPEFCRVYCQNFIADCSDPCSIIGKDPSQNTELAMVISLNGLSFPFINTFPDIKDKIPELEDFEDVNKDVGYTVRTVRISTLAGQKEVKKSGFDDWLDTRLKDKTLDEVESFLYTIFKVLNYRFEHGDYYHPVWVTKWTDFERYTKVKRADGSLDVDRWNQVVGVPRYMDNWQIVLKYPASAVECLYRPTVLDGGCVYPQHFPSPPDEPTSMGGLTMDLGGPDSILLPEFIHKQIKLELDYWVDAGRLIGQTRTEGYTAKLSENRNNHHEKLISQFGKPIIEKWMKKAI